MALSTLELNTLDSGMLAAKRLIEELKPILDELNVVYDGAGGVKSTVTQDNLDAVVSYSGITKEQTEDGMYVLTATIRDALDTGYSQLAIIAARKATPR